MAFTVSVGGTIHSQLIAYKVIHRIINRRPPPEDLPYVRQAVSKVALTLKKVVAVDGAKEMDAGMLDIS